MSSGRITELLAYGCVGVALCLTFGFDTRPDQSLPRDSALRPVRGELDEVVSGLARDGLPTDMVVRKVREGVAKRVAPERVLAAARGVAAEVRLADRIVRKYYSRPGRRGQLIRAAVAAHRAGVPLAGIDEIVGAAARVEPTVSEAALFAASDLAGRGYPADGTVRLVVELVGRDRRADELPRVLAVVEAARVTAGLDPDAALGAVAAAIAAGQDLETAGRAALFEAAGKQR